MKKKTNIKSVETDKRNKEEIKDETECLLRKLFSEMEDVYLQIESHQGALCER